MLRLAAGFAVLLELVKNGKGAAVTFKSGRKKEFFGKLRLEHNGSLSVGKGRKSYQMSSVIRSAFFHVVYLLDAI